jgi:hypothetical protein
MKNKVLILLAAIFITQIYLVSALTISSVKSNPSEVQPGETITLDLTIKNDLNKDIDNVVVSLNLNGNAQEGIPAVPFAPYQSSNQRTIESIDSDDHETVHFDLIALSDATSGTYTIPVIMSYDNQTDTGLVSITINAKPKIDISSEESSLIKGKNGKITLMIVNSGLGGAKFLSVSLGQVGGVQITSPNSIYIGNIDSNDFDTEDFNVFLNANAPSTINLPVQITYTDSQNNQITKNENVLIKTYTQREAVSLGLTTGNNTFLIIILIIVVIIGFFIYRRIRKRRRNKTGVR